MRWIIKDVHLFGGKSTLWYVFMTSSNLMYSSAVRLWEVNGLWFIYWNWLIFLANSWDEAKTALV